MITFKRYFRQLSVFVFTSSIVLGFILGGAMLYVGKTTMDIKLELEFGTFDGFWLIFGLPILSVVLFLLLSPFSYLVSKLFWSKRKPDEQV